VKTEPISGKGVLLRLVFAVLLVLLTFNPSGYSYFHWALIDIKSFDAVKAFGGALLLVGWVVALRTSFISLGALGIVLVGLVLGSLVWMLFQFGVLQGGQTSLLAWIVLIAVGLILGIGLSWSLIRARLTGEVEVD
jgi:Family of unknown function (DUF6524)